MEALKIGSAVVLLGLALWMLTVALLYVGV